MADFDQFQSADSQNMEDDPAADFLAREQSELAGLEDDNANDSAPQEGDSFNAFGDENPVESNTQNGPIGDGLDDFTGDNEQLFDVSPSVIQSDGLLDMDSGSTLNGSFPSAAPLSNGPSDAYSSVSQQDTIRIEPEKIRVWREEQQERLENKDAAEVKKKEEWQGIAKKELEDWYKHHAEQLCKARENNLAAEKAFIKERDESVPGHEWEKICRLCEFNPKHSKSTKDVTRMRSILLQLKQTPLVR